MQQLSLEMPGSAPLSLTLLLLNLGVGLLLALVLRWHYERFGSTLANRREFAGVFPFILLTTILIITVVKSSLALSLGLVGALSIVRFRTPIKEPEELAYLFMAIAMGLGLGADQTVPTVAAAAVILTAVGVLRLFRSGDETKNLYLSVEWSDPGAGAGGEGADESRLEALNAVIARHVSQGDLRRVDAREGGLEVTWFVDVSESGKVSGLIDELQRTFPGVGVSFIDQNQLPSV